MGCLNRRCLHKQCEAAASLLGSCSHPLRNCLQARFSDGSEVGKYLGVRDFDVREGENLGIVGDENQVGDPRAKGDRGGCPRVPTGAEELRYLLRDDVLDKSFRPDATGAELRHRHLLGKQ